MNKEDLPMFTGEQRTMLLYAHAALETTIKFTKGGLAALGANSKDVDRIALASVAFKKFLDDAHDRERWEFDPEFIPVAAQALAILVDKQNAQRKKVLQVGVEHPDDIDKAIELAKSIGRQLRPELFPKEEKQADVFDDGEE